MLGNPSYDNLTQISDIESLDPKSGGNRIIWDMRYPGFTSFDGMILYSSPNLGPKVTPGKYNIKMTYNNMVMEKQFEILKDPRVPTSQEGYENQLEFLSLIHI